MLRPGNKKEINLMLLSKETRDGIIQSGKLMYLIAHFYDFTFYS